MGLLFKHQYLLLINSEHIFHNYTQSCYHYFSKILYPNPTELEKKYLYQENYFYVLDKRGIFKRNDLQKGDVYANPFCSPFLSAIFTSNYNDENIDDIKLFIKEKGIGIIYEYGYGQTERDPGQLRLTNAISYVDYRVPSSVHLLLTRLSSDKSILWAL